MARKSKTAIARERDKRLRDQIIDKAIEQRELDSRCVNRRAAVSLGRDKVFLQDLESTLHRVFSGGIAKARPYKGPKTKKHDYIMNVMLSDLHYRAVLDPEEVPRAYDLKEEARRTGKVAWQVASYKRKNRPRTKLYIHLIGDIIQGMLHDARSGDPLTIQFAGALHYLVHLFRYWASEFGAVEVFCVPGNHGRNTARHKERAVHQKWDSIETMLYISLRYAMKTCSNVKFHIGKRPYYTYEAFDQKGFMTHGDTVIRSGYPGKVIKVEDIRTQVLKWNNSRDVNGPFQLFGAGHVHIASETWLPGGIVFMTNGCLVPPDPHAVSIGSTDVTCGVHMWESVPGHILGDHRFITVYDADEEPKYEDIIPRFDKSL